MNAPASHAGQENGSAIPGGHQAGNNQQGHHAAGGAPTPQGRFTRYLKCKGDAYCHTHEGLYMLMPEAEPSIGYKLQQVTGNIKSIIDQAEEITEDTAMHILFRPTGASKDQ